MSIYGYARVSTSKQSVERQITNITKAYPSVSRIYKDSWTGTTNNRPEFSKLLRRVKSGDTIVFDSVDRMSRIADEGTNLYHELDSKGVNLVFLKEPHINTETYHNALSLSFPDTGSNILQPIIDGICEAFHNLQDKQVQLAFDQAEKEVMDTRQRIREGMREKESGKKISNALAGKSRRSPKAEKAEEIIKRMSKDFVSNGLSDTELIPLTGVSRNTFYKIKRAMKKGESTHDRERR